MPKIVCRSQMFYFYSLVFIGFSSRVVHSWLWLLNGIAVCVFVTAAGERRCGWCWTSIQAQCLQRRWWQILSIPERRCRCSSDDVDDDKDKYILFINCLCYIVVSTTVPNVFLPFGWKEYFTLSSSQVYRMNSSNLPVIIVLCELKCNDDVFNSENDTEDYLTRSKTYTFIVEPNDCITFHCFWYETNGFLAAALWVIDVCSHIIFVFGLFV